tara:strand:+ start:1920 stop:2402 length:483 start_codon:yes stop_codon:yes gene_type:complete
MLASLGFYFTFIFKIILGGVLSLIIGYLNRENEDSESLKSYFMLSLITISLVSILDNYASNNSSQILTFLIPTIFGILFIFTYKASKQVIVKVMLFLCVSIFIGLGYYISSITFVILIALVKFLFNGVFDFFILEQGSDNVIDDECVDIVDNDFDLVDKE